MLTFLSNLLRLWLNQTKIKIDFSIPWYWLLFHVFWLIVLVVNFTPEKYLIGWDALNPEFNINVNLERSIFAGWQENYGTGTLGGHGFAATLPDTIAAAAIKPFLPDWAVRQVITLSLLYLGSLGAALLIRYVLNHYLKDREKTNLIPIISMLAGLFYGVNLGIVQIFYLPLEAFTFQFAFLPWIYLWLITFLDTKNKKALFWLFVVNWLGSVQGFIPSLFLGFLFGVTGFLILYSLFSKEKIKVAIYSLAALLVILLANSYWLAPFSYYVFANNDSFLHSYNNLISTPEFVEKNLKYGNPVDVAFLKSAFLDGKFNTEIIFHPWLNHYQFLPVSIIASAAFLISLYGVVISLAKSAHPSIKSLSIIYFFYWISLITNTLPFSLFTKFIYWLSPTLEQAFRTPFTKFGITLAFFYSIFFAVGLVFIVRLISRQWKQYQNQIGSWIVGMFFLFTIVLGIPYFSGEVFYKNLLVTIPDSYFDYMSYINQQENGRIADFPVDCSEGWYTYSWGYNGSGFLWYGTKQPYLARSFDVWSNNNESYFWEISHALKQQDYQLVESVLAKYDVEWILWDKNLNHCQSTNGFDYLNGYFEYLSSSKSNYSLDKLFQAEGAQTLYLYKRSDTDVNNFVTMVSEPITVYPNEQYFDSDQALLYTLDYISSENAGQFIYFPFRSLLSNRNGLEDNQTLEVTENFITVSQPLPDTLAGSLHTKSYEQLNLSVPVELLMKRENSQVLITAKYSFPEIFLDNKSVFSFYPEVYIGTFPYQENQKIVINQFEIADGKGVFQLGKNNLIQVISPEGKIIFSWNSNTDKTHQAIISQQIVVNIPESAKQLTVTSQFVPNFESHSYQLNNKLNTLTPKDCENANTVSLYEVGKTLTDGEYIQMNNQKNSGCFTLDLTYLDPLSSYLVIAKTQHVTGNPLEFNLSSAEGIFVSSTKLSTSNEQINNYFILPSTAERFAYRAQFKNSSLKDETINRIYDLQYLLFPYELLKDLKITNIESISSQETQTLTNRLNETQYLIQINQQFDGKDNYIALTQSYDKAWIAFPDWKFWEILPHYSFRNWANAWRISKNNEKITIFYLPQLLTLMGFSITATAAIWMWLHSRKH